MEKEEEEENGRKREEREETAEQQEEEERTEEGEGRGEEDDEERGRGEVGRLKEKGGLNESNGVADSMKGVGAPFDSSGFELELDSGPFPGTAAEPDDCIMEDVAVDDDAASAVDALSFESRSDSGWFRRLSPRFSFPLPPPLKAVSTSTLSPTSGPPFLTLSILRLFTIGSVNKCSVSVCFPSCSASSASRPT